MNYGVIQPPEQLADYVRFFWFVEGNQPYIHHAFAYPCPELIFCYKGHFRYGIGHNEDRAMSAGVFGQTETFSRVTLNKSDFGILGAYLYPHAFPQLFRLPAAEITNQALDMKTLCGRDGEILEEKIMLAASNGQRVKLICDFLKLRLKNIRNEHSGICSVIKAVSKLYTETSVLSLAEDNFLSLRQFERRFKELSGFRPKLFLQIARFNSLLNKPFQDKSLTELAYQHGYYDPAHFTHDFRRFSNRNPKEYFNEQTVTAMNRGTVEFGK